MSRAALLSRDESVKQVLAAMGDSHRANIEACGRLLDSIQAGHPA